MPAAPSSISARRSGCFRPLRRGLLAGVGLGFFATLTLAEAEVAAAPLAPPIPADRPMGFTRLAPETTGLTAPNAYADPTMWGARNHAFKFGAIGTGVAIGDVDNDGRPDVLVVRKTEPLRLFRNLGDWRFAEITAAAGLVPSDSLWREGLTWVRGLMSEQAELAVDRPERWKQGAAFADVNNDGWLDLYVCRFDAPNWLFINQGDGTFREEATDRGVAVRDASGQAAFADYDGDGWLDFFLQTNLLDAVAAPAGQPDRLFRNNGDGTFTDVTAGAGLDRGPTQGHAAIWWDHNDDGRPDLYLANDFAPPDRLYRNNGDGTFTDVLDAVVPHTPHSAMGADLGDVDNDGRIDFFVADMEATSHRKDHRGMAQVRALLNNAPEEPGVAPQLMRNALYLNTGTGHMLEAARLAGLSATDWTWSPRLEDFDNDGRLDLHVTNGMVRELHNADIVRRLAAAESPAAAGRLERGLPRLDEPNLAFRNLGDLTFEAVGPAWGLDQVGVSFGSATGDLDGDGDLDLVYTNYEDDITVLRNDAPAGGRLLVELRGTRSNRFGVGAKVTLETDAGPQVRTLTSARGYLSTSEPVLHFGLGETTRVRRLTVEWPSGVRQRLADVAAGQRLRIQEPDTPPAARPAPPPARWRETAAAVGLDLAATQRPGAVGNGQPLLPRRFDRRAPDLAAGDLNGDGRIDLLLGGTTTDNPRVVLAVPGGRFGPPLALPIVSANGPVALLDVDGDGDLDALFTRVTEDRSRPVGTLLPELWHNDGRGGFRAAPTGGLPALPLAAGAIAVGDFNRDGHPDVFLGARLQIGAYPETPRSVLLLNRGDGTLADASGGFAPGLALTGMVTAAVATDLDGDGWTDLVLATDWGPVQWWRNDRGRGLREATSAAGFGAAGHGWWSSLQVADLNGDGRPEVFAGNVGLNTPYRATPAAPAVLVRGDFADRGEPLLIEAHHEGDRLLPWRPRLELANEIRDLRRRFRQDDDFAEATLAEILGAERLAGAQRWTATELRSGVFWQETPGVFRFEALPRRAQIAPAMAAAALDWDGDGTRDLVLAQNDFAPLPAVGRFAGGIGQVLRGTGGPAFAVLEPAASGWVVPGAAQAIVVLPAESDRGPLVLVSRAGAPLLAFTPNALP